MYLLFLKGLRNLFAMLTFINLPIMYIYAGAGGTSRLHMGSDKIFGTFNLGNLGQDSIVMFSYSIWRKNEFINDQFVE